MAHGPAPKLLVLASTFPAGAGDGTPGFVRDLAARVSDRFDTLVLVPMVPGAAQTETADGIAVRRFRFFAHRWEDLAHGAILENLRAKKSRILQLPFLVIAEFLAVRKAVKEHRPNVIHAHWIVPQGLVARWAAPRVPLVVTTLGGDLYALNDPISRALKRSVLRHATSITVMNEDMAERAIRLGAAPAKVSVRPMGADVTSFAAQAAVEPRSPRGKPVRLIAVGRLVEKKGMGVLIEALRRGQAGDWELTIVGDGPLRRRLENAASGLPITFVGQLTAAQLAQADGRAHIAVFASVRALSGDQDGLPVALLEAMASGCAVVVSDLPGLREAVVNGESGLVVASGDSDALADALDALIADPNLRSRLGRNAAARALKEYDVKAVANGYAQLLMQAADAEVG